MRASIGRRMTAWTTTAAMVGTMLAAAPAVAQQVPQECFVVADSTNALGRIDLMSLTETLIGPTGVPDIESVTMGPGDVLYAADADDFGTIDLDTGAYTSIGPFGSATAGATTLQIDDVDSLAWDAVRGVMWGTAVVNGPDPLFQIDITTGAIVPGVFGGDDFVYVTGPGSQFNIVDDMSVEPGTGTLFATVKTPPNDQTITVDPVTGVGTSLPSLSGADDVEGLAFDRNGVLLGTTGAVGVTPNDLWSFDTVTGVGTKLMDLGVTGGDYEGVECRTVPNVIDLAIDKTVDNPTPGLGQQVTFTQVLVNEGPDDATGVEVQDLLPAGVTYVSDDSGGAYDPTTGTWTVGDLVAGASATLSITVTADQLGEITNFTEVCAANETDIDSIPCNDDGDQSEDDESSSTIVVVDAPFFDLALTKTASQEVAERGETVTFSIVVTNEGTIDGTGIQVTDELVSPGLGEVGNISDGGVLSGTTISWLTGFDLAVGESRTLTYDITVADDADPGVYIDVAQISAADQPDDIDSTPGNEDGTPFEDDEDEAQVRVPEQPASRLEGTVWHDDDRNGVIDSGENRFEGVRVVLVGPGPDATLGTADDEQIAEINTDVNGDYGFTVGPGDYIVRVDTTNVPAGFEQVFDLDDTLDDETQVTLPDNTVVSDIDFGYDDDPDTFDLVLTKSAGAATEGKDDVWTVDWTITVRNDGPLPAPGPITLTDQLPAELGFQDVVEPAGWSCSVAASTLTCTNPDDMAVGATAVFTLSTTIDADPGEIVTNPAQVRSSGDEPDLTNNDDSDTTAIRIVDTGAESDRMTGVALAMITLGGALLVIGGRRPEETPITA